MGFLLILFAVGSLMIGLVAVIILTVVTLLVNRKVNMPYVLPSGIVLFLLLFPLQGALHGLFYSTSDTSAVMNDLLGVGLFVPGILIVSLYWLLTVWIDYVRRWPLAILFTVLTGGLIYLLATMQAMICIPILMLEVAASVAIKSWEWFKVMHAGDASRNG